MRSAASPKDVEAVVQRAALRLQQLKLNQKQQVAELQQQVSSQQAAIDQRSEELQRMRADVATKGAEGAALRLQLEALRNTLSTQELAAQQQQQRIEAEAEEGRRAQGALQQRLSEAQARLSACSLNEAQQAIRKQQEAQLQELHADVKRRQAQDLMWLDGMRQARWHLEDSNLRQTNNTARIAALEHEREEQRQKAERKEQELSAATARLKQQVLEAAQALSQQQLDNSQLGAEKDELMRLAVANKSTISALESGYEAITHMIDEGGSEATVSASG